MECCESLILDPLWLRRRGANLAQPVAFPHPELETLFRALSEMRSPLFLFQWQRSPLETNSLLLDIYHYGTNVPTICAFYQNHYYIPNIFTWEPSVWNRVCASENRIDVTVSFLAEKKVNHFTHVATWKTEAKHILVSFFLTPHRHLCTF